jgi:predicted nucleic acid-binding protein
MLAVDVNVLVYAHRSDADGHDAWRDWVDAARRGPEPLGLIDQVLAGFVRIVTHPACSPGPVRSTRRSSS